MLHPSPLDGADQLDHLRVFLRWLVPVAAVFGMLELLAWQVFDDQQTLGAGLIILAYVGVAMIALWQIRRGHLTRAALIAATGVLIAALALAVIQPVIYPPLVVVTIIAIAIALPYLHGRHLVAVLVTSWLVAIAIAALGTFRPVPSNLPTWFIAAFDTAAVAATIGLTAILLWQYGSRLTDAARRAQQAALDLEIAQAERIAAERRLAMRERHESLGILAGGIAHDFNNLLTTVLGHTELLEVDLPATTSPQTSESLTAISTAARRAADLSRQMLAYSGRGTLALEPVDAVAFTALAAADLRPLVPERIVFSHKVVGTPGRMTADPGQLRQALEHLVRNAVEAVERCGGPGGEIQLIVGTETVRAGDPAPAIAPDAPLPGRFVTITVRDSGPGITPELGVKVFEPFTTTGFVGRGLGLPVVLGVARGHGGSVGIEPVPSGGSAVTLRIPAV